MSSDIDDVRGELTALASDVNSVLQLAGSAGRELMDLEPRAATTANESPRSEASDVQRLLAEASTALGDAVKVLAAAHTILIPMAATA